MYVCMSVTHSNAIISHTGSPYTCAYHLTVWHPLPFQLVRVHIGHAKAASSVRVNSPCEGRSRAADGHIENRQVIAVTLGLHFAAMINNYHESNHNLLQTSTGARHSSALCSPSNSTTVGYCTWKRYSCHIPVNDKHTLSLPYLHVPWIRIEPMVTSYTVIWQVTTIQ